MRGAEAGRSERKCSTRKNYSVPSNADEGYRGVMDITNRSVGGEGEYASHLRHYVQWGPGERMENNGDEGAGSDPGDLRYVSECRHGLGEGPGVLARGRWALPRAGKRPWYIV